MIAALRSGRGRPGASPRLLASAMLACALLLRLLVPAGWMPVRDATGLHLTICTGTGPMAMPMAPGTTAGPMAGMAHHMPGDQQGIPEHPCAFAHHGLAVAAPRLPALVRPLAPVALLPAGLATRVAIGRGLAAPPPPPTGPPSLA